MSNWIKIELREATDEEKEEYANLYGLEKEDIDMTYDCVLPEDGEEVLVTTKYGNVDKAIFYSDMGCYFENYEDWDDVLAWMPLPKPYKESENL